MSILLTRPEEDSLKLKNQIESLCNKKCYIFPLLDILYLEVNIDIPDKAIVLITSVNGIRALAQNTKKRGFNIVTVGMVSLSEAIELGFRNAVSAVESENQNASEMNLINYIKARFEKSEPLFHISADITKGGLKKKLIESGYKYNRVILYNSIAKNFTPSFMNEIKAYKYNIISFFSPRTAAIFSKQIIANNLNSFLENTAAFCFSENVLLGLAGMNFSSIHIPEVTNTENFIKLICEYGKQE